MDEGIAEMDMNQIIIVCVVIGTVAAAACMFGRSQMIQRVGCMELVMVAAVGGCALFGYLKAADFATEQYQQMLAISLESAEPYLADLEDAWEVYGGSDEVTLEETEQIVMDALPILQSGEARYTFDGIWLVRKDERGVYRESFPAGKADFVWENLQAAAVPLIGRALRSRATVWQEYEGETTMFAVADQSRLVPAYALVVLVSRKPLLETLAGLKTQYFYYSLLFLAAATLLVVLVVLLQEKEMHRILRLLVRAAKGGEETASILKRAEKSLFCRANNETQALHSSLRQIAINTERMNYFKYQILRAYYRFAPKEMERILGKQSILDVAFMEQAELESTVAFVSFAVRKDLSGGEYLRQMNRNYALLCEGRREFGGSIVSGGSNPGVMLVLFYEENRNALQFGIRMTVRELADQMAGQVFVCLHRAPLLYGVAGDEEQSFSYLYSEEVSILQKYTDSLRAMGIRMVVTACVWETAKEEAASRYIGYIEEGKERFDLYEILDVYPEEERSKRLADRADFQQALALYYRRDFYLARNLFLDILRHCPGDKVAKRYIFQCESGLNSDSTRRHSFGLFAEE